MSFLKVFYYRALSFIASICFASSVCASSCYITEDMVNEWNQKYGEDVQITAKEKDGEFLVEASFPLKLGESEFEGIWLFKGQPVFDATLMNHDFSMPIAPWKKEDGYGHIFYTVKSYLASENYLSITYGEDCGMYIQFPVIFTTQ
ncbi:hypothetical protein P4S60_08725 [Pseudoalteromonas sp. Hal040]|uniref:hypothetical protein n=1 Tax=unclassified Pseudoalteromonas TaxID=194690 RepID=UPI00110BF4EB|nr:MULTISPECIES: hypothetical protein [unclassified Pseudoalteromonas]